MLDEKPLVSIIILNWNGYDVTRDCLHSLQSINYVNYNVVLVDNGSVDNSVAKLKAEFTSNKLFFLSLPKNLGFTGGNNVGIKYACDQFDPKYVLLLNNDTIVEKDFLDFMLDGFHDPNCYAVVPKIYYFDHPNRLWFAGGRVSRLTGTIVHYGVDKIDNERQYEASSRTGFMNGCCALISRQSLNEIGLLDPQFFANSEDADYSLRILDSGHSIRYQADAVIYHKCSYSFKANKGQWLGYYLGTRAIVLMQRKHLAGYKLALFYFLFSFRWLLYLTLKFSVRFDFKSVKSIYVGAYDGMIGRLQYVNA
ncbi:glycosyltransferase family 2 protein [Pedobacter sandarakinus]|uniref:glycosyltransferase family 2 protein n=1 Tax=Pedobacter sandarakinus TaxID=353156 RepID=UPI0022468DC9|nr:glycosyltransferase family 2 protein [Pedobacter sandarakinus]MCX2574019.1 glycosyltransferase family 2 protein [Pedobacter sandarakinus]